ncbi:MAG: arsenate reductase family protein [Verrucomicrobiota bacterium]
MRLKVYEYKNCGTCRKALKFLTDHGIAFTKVPIREQPPTRPELRRMLKLSGGNVRKLFNTSGQDYKALDLKRRLEKMTSEEALDLLASNGNLVKRPFVLAGSTGLIGFKPSEWERAFGPGKSNET